MSRAIAAFGRLAAQAFLNLAVALILFVLPADVLFRLGSWSLAMRPVDIAADVAMMVVLLALACAVLAALYAVAGGALLWLAAGERAAAAQAALHAAPAVLAVAVIAVFVGDLLVNRIALAASDGGLRKALVPALPAAIAGALALWIGRAGWGAVGAALRPRLARGHPVTLLLILASAAAVAVKGVALHDPDALRPNPVPPPRPLPPNVILLTVDTLAAGEMSLHGYARPTTPALEKLAGESYVFEHFFAASNWTPPSVAAFLSGLHPVTTGMHPTNSYLHAHDRQRNLAQLLLEAGYRTAAVVASDRAHPVSLRIAESFSVSTEQPVRRFPPLSALYDALFLLKEYRVYWWLRDFLAERSPGLVWRMAESESLWPPQLAFERARALLPSLVPPYFLWIHILPPHDPYLPAAPFRGRFANFDEFSTVREFAAFGGRFSDGQARQVERIRRRYDEFILDTDAQIGQFVQELRAAGRLDDSIFMLTSDHGESFTRNFLYHGGRLLHQPLIHVPFLVRLPGQKEGRRIPHYAGHVDVLPTVLDLLGLPVPAWAEGESLKAAMLEGRPTAQPKFSMNLDSDSRFAPPGKGTVAVMHGGWKLVRYLDSGAEELYHLAADPEERANLAASRPQEAKRLRAMLYSRFKLAR